MATLNEEKLYISKILIGENTYEIKDTTAREMAEKGVQFVVATDASNTPAGVTWTKRDGTTQVTGELVASATTAGKIYLVLKSGSAAKVVYAEYVTISETVGETTTYSWEQLGDTEVSLKGFVKDVKYVGGALTPGDGDQVLGEATTFTNADSSVTFGADQTKDAFVKSYPGVTGKLVKASITGIDGSQSVTGIESNTAVTASKATAAADKSASKVTTASYTATNTIFGTDTTASKATAGTAVNVATTGTAVSFNAFEDAYTDIVRNLHVSGEILSFSNASTAAKSVTPAEANGTITPYTFADVTVPVVTSNASSTFNGVDSNTNVTISQFTFADVDASKVVSATAFTAAKPAASASTFATGAVAEDGTGAELLTGLGTAVTSDAITAVGTATAAAQVITVGTNDKVKVAKYDDLELSVTKQE